MEPTGGPKTLQIGDFVSILAEITLDLGLIGEAFGRWGVERYREWELCCDALTLQWYAVQNFLALKGATDRFSDPLLHEIVRYYNRVLEDYEIPDGIDPEMKAQVLSRSKHQRLNYDKLLNSGKNRSFFSTDFQLDIGATFAFLSGNLGSFKVRKLGTELYGKTLERCITYLGKVKLEDKYHAKQTEQTDSGE